MGGGFPKNDITLLRLLRLPGSAGRVVVTHYSGCDIVTLPLHSAANPEYCKPIIVGGIPEIFLVVYFLRQPMKHSELTSLSLRAS